MNPSYITRTSAEAASVIILAAFLSCQPRSGLVQETRPSESAVVDVMGAKTARIRSIYCDITVEPLDESDWDHIARTKVYRRAGQRPAFRRTPPLTVFLVTVKNTVNAPIRLVKAQVLYPGAAMDALTADNIKARFRSPAYSLYDFGRMLSPRRFLVEPNFLKRLDFDLDTIETKLDFIPPQDHAVSFIAFDRIPVEIRKFKVAFSVTALGTTRGLAVEFIRNEYRGSRKKQQEAFDEYYK